jgi:hypothetical protein
MAGQRRALLSLQANLALKRFILQNAAGKWLTGQV